MAQRRLGVLDAVGHAVVFAKANWRAVIGALTLVAVGAAGTMAGQYLGDSRLMLLAGALYYPAAFMAYGALYRRAFAGEHPQDAEFRAGPAGFQWRAPEWRLLGAGLYLVAVIAALVLGLVVASVAVVLAGGGGQVLESLDPTTSPEALSAALMEALGPQTAALLSFLVLVFGVLVVWLAVRLSLYMAAVVAEKRVVLFGTWKLTKGRFWLVFASTVLVSLPSLAASGIATAVEQALGSPGAGGVPVLPLGAALTVSVLSAVVTAYVQLPLSAGLFAELYRRLRAETADRA